MDSKTLEFVSRTDLGKGGSARIRKEGRIPAIIYGHNEPVTISIDAREFNKKFHAVSENTIISLKGKEGSYDVLVKDYQDDIISNSIVHIDFFEIERGKTLRTNVPIHTTGTSVGVKMGGVLEVTIHDLEIECLPKDLPQEILIDISAMDINSSVHVADIAVPSGVKILTSPEASVLHISAARKEEETVAAVAADTVEAETEASESEE